MHRIKGKEINIHMKIELFVLDINYTREISSLTLPLLSNYADRIGAKFTRITTPVLNKYHISYEKMQLYDLGMDNDWNVLVDCDIIIKESMYNVIEIVPNDGNHIGAWQSYWEPNLYNNRGIDVAIAGNFLVVPRKCHEVFRPLDKDEHPELWLDCR